MFELGGDPRVRRLLERVEARHHQAAAIQRRHGQAEQARHAELSATRIRLMLDEPAAFAQMKELLELVGDASHYQLMLDRALDGAMRMLDADFGNVQVQPLGTRRLEIAASSGFGDDFLQRFAVVEDQSTACGQAAEQGTQVIIPDVDHDPAFAPHRPIAAASGFRAVQSTPMIDDEGRLRGVISTHFRETHRPSARDLELLAWFAERVATALATQQRRPFLVHESAAVRHEQTADLHAVTADWLDRQWPAADGLDPVRMSAWSELARQRAEHERERAAVERRHARTARAGNLDRRG
jgi:GAF domain-containing protein